MDPFQSVLAARRAARETFRKRWMTGLPSSEFTPDEARAMATLLDAERVFMNVYYAGLR